MAEMTMRPAKGYGSDFGKRFVTNTCYVLAFMERTRSSRSSSTRLKP